MKKIATICFLILCSCGHSTVKINKETFLIEKRGNGFSSEASVRKDFLKQCAESTIENGFDYFTIIDEEVVHRSFGTKPSRSGMVKGYKEGSQPSGSMNAKEILQNLD